MIEKREKLTVENKASLITHLHNEWLIKNGYSIKATRRIRGRSTTDDPGSQKGN